MQQVSWGKCVGLMVYDYGSSVPCPYYAAPFVLNGIFGEVRCPYVWPVGIQRSVCGIDLGVSFQLRGGKNGERSRFLHVFPVVVRLAYHLRTEPSPT